jgi:hypothetical protein
MRIKPNRTVVRGRVRAIRPEPDGYGAELELEVLANESPSPDEDFLRPAPGSRLKAFLADPEQVKLDDEVRVLAVLVAGPRGGRAVIESVTS